MSHKYNNVDYIIIITRTLINLELNMQLRGTPWDTIGHGVIGHTKMTYDCMWQKEGQFGLIHSKSCPSFSLYK